MFNFGSEVAKSAPDFLPDADARSWIEDGLLRFSARFGPIADAPRVVMQPPARAMPRHFDGLFDLICGVQSQVGQQSVEFELVETRKGNSALPDSFEALGDPNGQMLHTLHRDGEYAMVFTPLLFKVPELLLSSVARELGRLAIHRAGGHDEDVAPQDYEADAEIAAVSIGLGVWVANGAYVFENGCCGGGCGIDLRSIRAGLSMPEACYAAAADAHRRGLSKRVVAKHLAATQKAAFKKSFTWVDRNAPAALPAGASPNALPG